MSLNERRGPRRGHVPLTSRPVRPSGRQRTAGRTTSVISSLSFADGSPSGTRGQRDRSPSTVIGRRNDAPRRVVLARRDVAQQPNLPLRRLRHESLNLRVRGSSPWRLTNKINNLQGFQQPSRSGCVTTVSPSYPRPALGTATPWPHGLRSGHPRCTHRPTTRARAGRHREPPMAEFVVPNAMGSAASDRATCPYFAHRLPVALDAERATFVFVQAEDVTETGVRTWGEQLAALWAARAPGPKPGVLPRRQRRRMRPRVQLPDVPVTSRADRPSSPALAAHKGLDTNVAYRGRAVTARSAQVSGAHSDEIYRMESPFMSSRSRSGVRVNRD